MVIWLNNINGPDTLTWEWYKCGMCRVSKIEIVLLLGVTVCLFNFDICCIYISASRNAHPTLELQERPERLLKTLGFFLWGQWMFSTNVQFSVSISDLFFKVFMYRFVNFAWGWCYRTAHGANSKWKGFILCMNMFHKFQCNLPINILIFLTNKSKFWPDGGARGRLVKVKFRLHVWW